MFGTLLDHEVETIDDIRVFAKELENDGTVLEGFEVFFDRFRAVVDVFDSNHDDGFLGREISIEHLEVEIIRSHEILSGGVFPSAGPGVVFSRYGTRQEFQIPVFRPLGDPKRQRVTVNVFSLQQNDSAVVLLHFYRLLESRGTVIRCFGDDLRIGVSCQNYQRQQPVPYLRKHFILLSPISDALRFILRSHNLSSLLRFQYNINIL